MFVLVNASYPIRFNCEPDSNEINESGWQKEKRLESRSSRDQEMMTGVNEEQERPCGILKVNFGLTNSFEKEPTAHRVSIYCRNYGVGHLDVLLIDMNVILVPDVAINSNVKNKQAGAKYAKE